MSSRRRWATCASRTRSAGWTRPQAEAHALEAFAKARQRCFALLDRPTDPDERPGFADYVSGEALTLA